MERWREREGVKKLKGEKKKKKQFGSLSLPLLFFFSPSTSLLSVPFQQTNSMAQQAEKGTFAVKVRR